MSKRISLPTSEEEIRNLHVGEDVLISGTMVTGRDQIHKYLAEHDDESMRTLLKDSFIYHCGPVVTREGDGWRFVAAGPTTSAREEPYEADVIERYGIRGIIGKGGMGEKTLKACKEYGTAYLHAVGGAGTLLAQSVVEVKDVLKLEEYGTPEAMWVIDVTDFPAIVTMDSRGESLHEDVLRASREALKGLLDA